LVRHLKSNNATNAFPALGFENGFKVIAGYLLDPNQVRFHARFVVGWPWQGVEIVWPGCRFWYCSAIRPVLYGVPRALYTYIRDILKV